MAFKSPQNTTASGARAKIDAARAQDRRRAARKRNMTIVASLVAAFAVIVAVFLAVDPGSGPDGDTLAAGESRYVRSDSHRLTTAADGKVTLVEFLDFECEACRGMYPLVESLRKEYEGRVTFVVRYFPLPGHFNAERAARAVEAAAQQDKFEIMYQRMYQTQTEWGEKRTPADEYFRGLAQGLGMDMAAWQKAYEDPATLARVKKDVADGQALGVQGTPTFYLNGTLVQVQMQDDLKKAIDAALAG
ncbi:DsbA family protein [Acrocarpospora catenulata]|uniref:DsbA family protein n=1 Tax=Acrocarpospora catenulata TaxID=2836182 RepID=UPI0027DFC078|nr:thioredoxin domain-containing protein [Acrocarpospora catenulata]